MRTQAVLGGVSWLLAGAGLGGILLGLAIAKLASDFFKRKEFDQQRAMTENAALRAKVGAGRGKQGAGGGAWMPAAAALPRRPAGLGCFAKAPCLSNRPQTCAFFLQVDELQQMVMVRWHMHSDAHFLSTAQSACGVHTATQQRLLVCNSLPLCARLPAALRAPGLQEHAAALHQGKRSSGGSRSARTPQCACLALHSRVAVGRPARLLLGSRSPAPCCLLSCRSAVQSCAGECIFLSFLLSHPHVPIRVPCLSCLSAGREQGGDSGAGGRTAQPERGQHLVRMLWMPWLGRRGVVVQRGGGAMHAGLAARRLRACPPLEEQLGWQLRTEAACATSCAAHRCCRSLLQTTGHPAILKPGGCLTPLSACFTST